MKALIYTRVMPDNKKVAKPDRLQEQEKRCRDFLRDNRITPVRTYSDQGVMHPQRFLPGMRSLLQHLARSPEEMLVICDHPGRLGLKSDIQKAVTAQIEDLGGRIITVMGTAEQYRASYSTVENILMRLEKTK